MKRVLIFCLCLSALAWVFYLRHAHGRVESTTREAINQIPHHTHQSYRILRNIFTVRGPFVQGRVEQAVERYLNQLNARAMQGLTESGKPPAPEDYHIAVQAIAVLMRLEQQTGHDYEAMRRQIAEAMRDSAGVLEREGTLSAWDAMLNAFEILDRYDSIPEGVFEEYEGWMATRMQVPRRAMALRDAQSSSRIGLRNALSQLGLVGGMGEGPLAVEMPVVEDEMRLVQADVELRQAELYIDELSRAFEDVDLTRALRGIKGQILYNRAALKLAHLLDLGESEGRLGSSFIATQVVNPRAFEVPDTIRMREAFMGMMQQELESAIGMLSGPNELEPSTRAALAYLAAHTARTWTRHTGAEATKLEKKMEKLEARVQSVRGLDLLRNARRSDRPLLMSGAY